MTIHATLAAIGMNLPVTPALDANIEDTLLFASTQAIERGDLQVLSMLIQWMPVHGPRVLAPRLTELVRAHDSARVRALWSALAKRSGDPRFEPLIRVHEGPPVDALPVGASFRVQGHGEDERFGGTALRVPANVLGGRPNDVFSPARLAHMHRAYRWRAITGPTVRADMWAALEAQPSLDVAELAHRTYGEATLALQVKREFETVRPWPRTAWPA